MYIHLYQGSVVAGNTSGTLISENTGLAPISVTLNATNNEVSSNIPLAIRCDSGYNTSGSTTVTPTGTSSAKWALSSDGVSFGSYGAALTIAGVIGTVNTLLYAKAKSDSSETPTNDVSVDLVVSCVIAAV